MYVITVGNGACLVFAPRFQRQARAWTARGTGLWTNKTVILGSRELDYLCMSKQSEATQFRDGEIRHLEQHVTTQVSRSLTRALQTTRTSDS